MRVVALIATTLAIAQAKNCTDELCHCGNAKDKALEALEKGLGDAWQTVKDKAKGLCDGLEEGSCNGECTFCSEDEKCYLKVDLSNKCYQKVVYHVTKAAEIGKDAVSAVAGGVKDFTHSCANMTTETACKGGTGVFCKWCKSSETCHFLGSPQNPCTINKLKAIAKETVEELANKAKNEVDEKLNEWKEACEVRNTSESCSENWECVWCGESTIDANTDSKDFNKCYFLGDNGNACANEKLKELVDGAKGTIKEIGEWAGDRYQDVKKWGENICGKHTAESPCDDDDKCTWCGDDSLCYIYASVHNPCGNFKKGVGKVKEFFTGLFSGKSDCSSAQQKAKDALNEALDYAKNNMAVACDSYYKDKFESQRFVAALKGQDVALTDEEKEKEAYLEDRFEESVVQTQAALSDAEKLDNELEDQQEALNDFSEANPDCGSETDGATGAAMLSASALFVTVTAWL